MIDVTGNRMPNSAFTQYVGMLDVDADGRIDVLRSGTAGVEWFRHRPNGFFGAPRQLQGTPTYPTDLVVEDLNADGLPDLVAAPRVDGQLLAWWENTGTGLAAGRISSRKAYQPFDTLNADGSALPDVVFATAPPLHFDVVLCTR